VREAPSDRKPARQDLPAARGEGGQLLVVLESGGEVINLLAAHRPSSSDAGREQQAALKLVRDQLLQADQDA
jgi:hypothetical protein